MNNDNKPAPLPTRITYLEMTELTAKRVSLPMNTHAALLVADKPPLHFYRYLQDRVGRPWKWESRLRLDDDALANIIHAPTTQINVLMLDGVPSGFFELNRAKDDVTDIAFFGMMPHATGRGLGKWFLTEAVFAAFSETDDHSPNRVTVNTCTLDHPAALPLYQKVGFKPIAWEQGHVVPLGTNDYMRLALAD